METAISSESCVRFGCFELNLRTGELYRNGVRLKIRGHPVNVLAILLEHPGELVTRETLQKRLWPDNTFVDFEQILNNSIGRLRDALGDQAESPKFIETLPRLGYRFNCPVKIAPGPHSTKGSVRSAERSLPPGFQRQLAPDSWSVAVLPFLNFSGDPEKDYFVDGLSEELIARLAEKPELRVIARTSAFTFRGKGVDVRAVGRALNVRSLVEGSVRWSGPRLRITVQMADCRDGYHLFAKSFDVEEKELLALQNEIAQMICGAIVPRLADRGSSTAPKLVDPEAYRLYLRGRYHWNRRTLSDFEKAIACCEKAIALQPDYAPAYACIADSCWMQCLDMLAPPGDLLARTKAAATRAVELDPGLAEAHSAFAMSCLYDWQHEKSAAHLRRAIELKPSYSTAHYLYACHHALSGCNEKALSEMRLALEIDPLSIMVNRAMVAGLLQAGPLDRALAQAKETIELDPGYYGSYLYLAWVYMALAQHDLAIEALEKAIQLGGNTPAMLGYLSASKAQLGKTEEAQAILRQLLDPAQPLYVPPLVIAVAFVALGKLEKALDFLERAVEERCGTIMHARQDPFFLPLHGMPRFDEICRRMNLI